MSNTRDCSSLFMIGQINRSRKSPPPPPPPTTTTRRRESDRDATSTCKRRRLAEDDEEVRPWASLPEDDEEVRPWASLPEDLVDLIGWRVLAGDLLDYVRFRAVCSHWTKSTLRPRGRGLVDPRLHPRRWMMLSQGHGLYPGHPNLGGYVRFFNLSTGRFVRVHLPLFDDHIVLDSVDGLLLLLLHRDHDTTIRLLNPFTGDIAEFPPLSSLLQQNERYRHMSQDSKLRELRLHLWGLCTAVTVSVAGTITVVIAFGTRLRIAHAKAGDQLWTLCARKLPISLVTPISFQGKVFGVSSKSSSFGRHIVNIWQIDLSVPNAEGSHLLSLQPVRNIAECPVVATMGAGVNLVECNSEIMLVGFHDTSFTQLVIYRLADLIRGRVVPITDIGEHAIFLGSRSLCLSSNGFPSVPGNSITCNYRITHDSQVGKCYQRLIEHYHLGSGAWSLAIPKDNSPASPYTLVHHIFTCCFPCHWNKGLMFHGGIRHDWSVKPNLWIGVSPSFDQFSSVSCSCELTDGSLMVR